MPIVDNLKVKGEIQLKLANLLKFEDKSGLNKKSLIYEGYFDDINLDQEELE